MDSTPLASATLLNAPAASAAQKLFFDVLGRAVREDRIRFVFQGHEVEVGAGLGQPIVVQIVSGRFFDRVLSQGNLGMGEAYMAGEFNVEQGQLPEFITALARANVEKEIRGDFGSILRVLGIRLNNLIQGRYVNVQSHYDVGDELFEAFLDESLAYSCGYMASPTDTLEQLQINKFDRICRKLRLKPGDTLLDIGCGFGGLLIHAAQHYGAIGTGITIAKRHCEHGKEMAAKRGVADKVNITFASHAEIKGQYDKIVSVGMVEHLMRGDYKLYFRNIKKALKPGGMGLVHGIGCNGPKNEHDPFFQKYIFPGSGQPRLSELSACLEKERLAILDVENIVRHYAPTVRHWNERLQQNYHKLDQKKYDATFKRMYEYYFACGVAAATATDSSVYQVLFSNGYAIQIPYQRV